MSLINEALKKAQSERPSSARQGPPMGRVPMDPNHEPPHKKRYLMSFIMAVLVVAVLSTILSTYLVYQILGDEDDPQTDNPSPIEEVAQAPVESPTATEPAESKPATSATEEPAPVVGQEPEPVLPKEPEPIVDEEPEPVVEQEPEPVVTEVVEQAAPAQENSLTPEPQPVETQPVVEVPKQPSEAPPVVVAQEQVPVATTPPPAKAVEKPKPKIASYNTNPEVWSRLETLEIRGIMSGGTKVLVFDSKTGKARTFKPGDLVDGALSLKVSSISKNVINFETHDGSIFPKSF